ncbi:26s proteasome regulatory complex non-atpase subcomplex rpn1 subunit [Ceraceosorus bombacis]|uniref:26S proteasome regulatory subunit RPN1 n=1 Tax=Ceraceosorus bombacis TaxID=401625 RepID=A0A0N7L9W8_9BASI|nr:26s proteasome regulatory complex non-atpase subcomplex rpn1 subunit [Ceraceosorus bombacis]
MTRQEAEQTIQVTSEDPKKKEAKEKEQERKDGASNGAGVNGDAKGKDAKKEDELSEEDLQLKNELEMLVERLKESEKGLYRPALESLRTLIRTSTSSMTSVPKPLKFLRPHYPSLKTIYSSWTSSEDKALFAEILSVLAMTYSDNGHRETLKFRVAARRVGGAEDPGLWGHEYMRHLAAELGEEYNARVLEDDESRQSGDNTDRPSADELLDLALLIVPFSLKHNAEHDAVDLLLELEAIDKLPQFVDKDTYQRTCLYMVSCVNLLVPPDDLLFLQTAHEIYRKHDRFAEAMTIALRLGDPALIRSDFDAAGNPLMRKQLAYMLGRQQVPIEWLQDEDAPIEDSQIVDAINNASLSHHFTSFGKELSVDEPKSLEDIYKSHLDSSNTTLSSTVDSARGNLASTFVNAFVNAGFGNDRLMVGAEEGNSWIYKNKDHGMLSAAASLGMSLLWDTEVGLGHIDKYTYSADENIKAGALMAYGILHSGVRTEMDAALALLTEHVDSKSVPLKVSAIVGIGIAYAGSAREDIVPLLLQHVADETAPMEVASLAALSLGFIFVGTSQGEIVPTILQTMMEREPSQLDDKWARFMGLALALLFLGQQDASDATIETLKAIDHPLSKQSQVLVDMCSFAGTGNVLKIQTFLHDCLEHLGTDDKSDDEDGGNEEGPGASGANGASSEHSKDDKEKEKPNDTFQGFAVIGIALVAMGEDVGSEMVLRHMGHLMHYGEPVVRRAVPLALALLNPSNPEVSLLDTLSKYSHDNDLDVAINSILAMGLVGAGTNNARLAQMLRQLANYYHKEPDSLFMVRVAQGLIHMGKGTIGLTPFHTDRQLMSRTAVCGLLATLVSFTEARGFVLDKSHWMLYWLVSAMYPRFLITLDEELKPLPVSTHTTPVRMGVGERAELADARWLQAGNVLEGISLLYQNPGWSEDD